MRILVLVLGVMVGCAAGAWMWAGRQVGPTLEIVRPQKLVGVSGAVELTVAAPGSKLTAFDAAIEQNGKRWPLVTLNSVDAAATFAQDAPDRMRVTRTFTRRDLHDVAAGPARIVVHAARPVLFGMRTAESDAARDIVFQFDPPRVAAVSTHHYIKLGGAEMIVYRATPPDVASGVRVGNARFPGYPAAAAGIEQASPDLKVAFFVLSYDDDLAVPMELYAEDEAGNKAVAQFDHRVFPAQFRKSRIELPESFLTKVTTEILPHAPDLKNADPANPLQAFLSINRELRQVNNAAIAALSARSEPKLLWSGAFHQLGNSQVEASFADFRTYFHENQEVDRQVHLGFDLAVTANVPVVAANAGKIAFADYLGIYGNCVIIDHGLGVQSLYGHLSSIDVKAGDVVKKAQVIGRSGMTGLAGGDHLHFTMVVGGKMVNPVEWWDAHWIEDRIMRKIREAGPAAVKPTAALGSTTFERQAPATWRHSAQRPPRAGSPAQPASGAV